MYYTHSCYQTSIFGENCAYYIRIFTVSRLNEQILKHEIVDILLHCKNNSMTTYVNYIENYNDLQFMQVSMSCQSSIYIAHSRRAFNALK